MKKFTLIAMILFMVCSCGATAMGMGDTARGARWAVNNNSIMTNGNLTVLFWPKGQSYGFAVFSNAGDPIAELQIFKNATKDNIKTIADFAKFLSGIGYNSTSSDGIPVGLVSSINSFRMALIAGLGSFSFYTMWAMPVLFYQPSGWGADVVVQ